MFDTTGKIAIAQLVFFVLAIFAAFYCFVQHGKHGLLGWIFLCVFCIIRVVGAAIIVSDESGNKPVSGTGLIISSVAIAPLIISMGGIAHESYFSITAYGRIIFGWIPHLLIHIGSVAAIVMIAMGYTKFEKANATADNMRTGIDLARAGGIILLIVWLGIAVIMMVSFRYPRALRGEKKLAKAVVIAHVALLVRIIYSILGSFINSTSFNPRTGGTIAEKVVLDVLPEFILTIVLLVGGIASRNIDYERQACDGGPNDSTEEPNFRLPSK